MRLKRPLYGPQDPRGPSHGRDVKDFVKRTLHRLPAQIGVGANFFPEPPGGFDDVYNEKTADAVRVVQQWYDLRPRTGNMGEATFEVLWSHADAYSRYAYRLWSAPKPKPPPLNEPVQGFSSLHKSLWSLYDTGIRMGLHPDLGTFNPASDLPSGAPSDHSVGPPAYAFDLGVDPDNGWDNAVGRAFFHLCMRDPACEYVILGDRIASRNYDWTIRRYSYGGHSNHVHVSGIR